MKKERNKKTKETKCANDTKRRNERDEKLKQTKPKPCARPLVVVQAFSRALHPFVDDFQHDRFVY